MQDYDFERTGSIETFDLGKVIKKLGIMNPEPHIDSILKMTGVPKEDRRIPYLEFTTTLTQQLAKRRKETSTVYERLMQKIFAILQVRDISIFEFFVSLDVNQSGKVSKLEARTGIQHFGLNMTNTEFQNLWDALKNNEGDEAEDTNKRGTTRALKGQPKIEYVDYEAWLDGFIKAGCLKV